tara:strand:- start:99 stop:929 length:831 start_codon:yes stop_codon:yes gene_type:complete
MDVANIIIITILILILAWVISYYFLTTNIIFDQILKADKRSSSGTPDKTNYIENKDFNENSTANFMLSVWFYIDNWGNQLSQEKNILFLGNNNTITTHPELKNNRSLSKQVCTVADNDLINYKNLSVSLDDYQNILNIDIETLPNKRDLSGCFTRYAIKNIPIQKWNCLIISVDTKTMDIYLDGKLRNSFILHGPYKSELDNAKKNIYLGAQSTENVGFEGYITRVRYEPNSINPKEAYNIYKEGINASLAKSLFNKYSLKVSFLEYNKERGTFTI